MSFVDICKLLAAASILSVLCYFFARGTHAQLCTTLTIPFKTMDDVKIYEASVGRMASPTLIAVSAPLVMSGAVALTSQYDPHYIKLMVFLFCTTIYVAGVSALSYSVFKKAISTMGHEWPPARDNV